MRATTWQFVEELQPMIAIGSLNVKSFLKIWLISNIIGDTADILKYFYEITFQWKPQWYFNRK